MWVADVAVRDASTPLPLSGRLGWTLVLLLLALLYRLLLEALRAEGDVLLRAPPPVRIALGSVPRA